MKRILTVILFLLFVGIPVAVSASNELTFAVDTNVSAEINGTVTIPIIVSNNPGFTAVGLVVMYDPNVLEIISVTAPVAAMPLSSQFALTTVPGTQWILLINDNLIDWQGNGVVANVMFNVKSDAPFGINAVNLAFTVIPDGTPGNMNGDILRTARTVSGSVNIIDSGVPDGHTPQNIYPSVNEPPVNQPPVNEPPVNQPPVNEPPVNQHPVNEPPVNQHPVNEPLIVITGNDSNGNGITNNFSNDYGQYLNIENEPIIIDDGAFIGNPYLSDDVGLLADDEAVNMDFGRVPQTGVPDIMKMIIAMSATLFASIALFAYVLRLMAKRKKS